MEGTSSKKPDSLRSHHQTQNQKLQLPQSKHPASRSLSTNPTNSKWLPHEDRLRKTWRLIGSTVANCMSKAEKNAVAVEKYETALAMNPAVGVGNSIERESTKRDLDDSVIYFLRTRREFHRLLSHAEAKLQGKAEEMESLETYVRTQPRVGTRKRRRL